MGIGQQVALEKQGRVTVYYNKRKPAERKNMTISIGMRCKGGIVLCSDRQLSSEGGYKYEEEKIFFFGGQGWKVATNYANYPGLMKEFRDDVEELLEGRGGLDLQTIHGVADSILTRMGRNEVQVPLELLLAIHADTGKADLLKFDGRALYHADDFECLGVGDSALIRYLREAAHNCNRDVAYGRSLAVYLVSVAKKYIRDCGDGPDVFVLKDDGDTDFGYYPETETEEERLREAEKLLLPRVIEAGIRPSS